MLRSQRGVWRGCIVPCKTSFCIHDPSSNIIFMANPRMPPERLCTTRDGMIRTTAEIQCDAKRKWRSAPTLLASI